MGTGGMFQLTSGSATKYYDASTDRLIIDVEGNISMNSISLEFAGKTYDTTNYKLPLNNNITINILDKSKNINIFSCFKFIDCFREATVTDALKKSSVKGFYSNFVNNIDNEISSDFDKMSEILFTWSKSWIKK